MHHDRNAPTKITTIRGNNKPHIDKNLRKEIMKRSQLKTKANKTGDKKDTMLYKKQRNRVSNLNKKNKKEFFRNNEPQGSSSKAFWDYCKPYFTNKGIIAEDKIILVENNEIISKESEIVIKFNDYFVNITKSLN